MGHKGWYVQSQAAKPQMKDAPLRTRLSMLGRADFAGRWTVTRKIADTYGAQAGAFEGFALLTPQGETGLVYAEEGHLRMGDGPTLTATRRYLWEFEEGGVTVRFADGRPFHRFMAVGAGVTAVHDCAPDLYHVTYDFSEWPRWQSRWRVTGPRKDYAMQTLYTPAAGQSSA